MNKGKKRKIPESVDSCTRSPDGDLLEDILLEINATSKYISNLKVSSNRDCIEDPNIQKVLRDIKQNLHHFINLCEGNVPQKKAHNSSEQFDNSSFPMISKKITFRIGEKIIYKYHKPRNVVLGSYESLQLPPKTKSLTFSATQRYINDNKDYFNTYFDEGEGNIDLGPFDENKSKNDININKLPDSITQLDFLQSLLSSLPSLPPKLTHLTLPSKFDQSLALLLPSSLIFLHLSDRFNQKISSLPLSLRTLQVGKWFANSLENLPSNLQSLIIGAKNQTNRRFEHSLDNLPPSLTSLSIYANRFNKSVDSLPSSLLHLDIKSQRFQKLLLHLPKSLLSLSVGSKYNQSIGNLPSSLTKLKVLSDHFEKDISLPSSLQYLKIAILSIDINESLRQIPSLQTLKLSIDYFMHPIFLPSTLCSLSLKGCDQTIDSLPPLLTHLVLPEYPFPLPPLPASLSFLDMGLYNHEFPSLPPNLLHLAFLSLSNSPKNLPSSLQFLAIRNYCINSNTLRFFQGIPDMLPCLSELRLIIREGTVDLYTLPNSVDTITLIRNRFTPLLASIFDCQIILPPLIRASFQFVFFCGRENTTILQFAKYSKSYNENKIAKINKPEQ